MNVTITEPTTDIVEARQALSRFVRRRAQERQAKLGFGYVGTPTAPSTYQQLRGAYAHSAATGEPLPISNLFCESSIYDKAIDNVAFRYWHDTSHVELGLSFELEDELELALWHIDDAEKNGFAAGSTAHNMLTADLAGQLLLMALLGRFPSDQTEFVVTCHRRGLLAGLLAEVRRIP